MKRAQKRCCKGQRRLRFFKGIGRRGRRKASKKCGLLEILGQQFGFIDYKAGCDQDMIVVFEKEAEKVQLYGTVRKVKVPSFDAVLALYFFFARVKLER